MALAANTRKQLVEAREKITIQLMQIEVATLDPYSLGGPPDFRGVYADLQDQRRDIDTLLGKRADDGDGGSLDDIRAAYHPMDPFLAAKIRGSWRFVGVGAGYAAFWIISFVLIHTMSDDREDPIFAGTCLAAICIFSVWIAVLKRKREFRLFLLTLAVGSFAASLALFVAGWNT